MSSRARTSGDPGVNWDLFEIASLAAGALRAEAARIDEEQAALGIDALDELALHDLLRRGIGERYAVLAEQRYPIGRGRSRRTEGERCDIVVLPEGADAAPHLTDPLEVGTLFQGRGIDPRQALWIEVKGVWHHALTDGIARPNPAYTSQLTRLVAADLRKLRAEQGIDWAAMMVIAFHESAAIADHDLAAWREAMALRGLMPAAPIMERFAITERIGNAVCSVVVAPVRDQPVQFG